MGGGYVGLSGRLPGQVMVEDNDTREGNFGKKERVQIYRG